MKINYLNMIWDVKIYLAKIKDGKGKELLFHNNKSLLTITRPKKVFRAKSAGCQTPYFR